jgi:beta-galactosidase
MSESSRLTLNRRSFLTGVAAAPAALSQLPVGATPPLHAPILAEVRIGAEFFLNTTETKETVDRHFKLMADTGLTVVRIFTLWDQVERERGRWNFAGYDWIYDAAARNGILIANTLCAEDPPGWMGTAPFYHQWNDISNPALQPYSEIYIDKVVNRYKAHPGHGAWLLQNEPAINEDATPHALAVFARWLEKKYGTVENLNKSWYRPLKRFEDVVPPVSPRVNGWSDYPSNLDWLDFRCDHLRDQLVWIHAQIDRHHPGALTHINPPGQTGNMVATGRHMWRLKPTAHFFGASMHAAWAFGKYKREDFGIAYGFCCDVVRSVSAPAPWWVTELQAGPTMFTGSRPLNPTAGEITRWLWDGIGNGTRAVVFWLWHPRTEGNEAGEWGLAGPSGESTPRTRATKAVVDVLRKHAAFFKSAKPVRARAAILYNSDAMMLYAVDSRIRPTDDITESLMGCYKALHRAHIPVDFIDTSELETGKAENYRVLYLPYSYALSGKSAEAIRQFVKNGGTVWADGLVGWKNERGVTLEFPPGPLADVFGFRIEDIDAQWEPFALGGRDDKAGESWRCVIGQGPRRVLLSDSAGRPTAVEHSFGKGRAIYYGSAVSLAYFRRDDPEAGEWIAGPARTASGDSPVKLLKAPAGVSFRVLESGSRLGAVLTNWGGIGKAVVAFPAGTMTVTELITGASFSSPVEFELPEGGSAVLLA